MEGDRQVPIEVRYLDNGIGASWLGGGVVTGQDLIDASKETFAPEERLKQIRYALVDFTHIEGVSISPADIRKKAILDGGAASIVPNTVVALVAPEDLTFGLARVWDAYVDGLSWETMVFRSVAEAESWIEERVGRVSSDDQTTESS